MLSRKYRKEWFKTFRSYYNAELDRMMTEKGLTNNELSNHINFMKGRIEKLRRNTCHVRMEEYVYLFSFLDKVMEIKLIDAKWIARSSPAMTIKKESGDDLHGRRAAN